MTTKPGKDLEVGDKVIREDGKPLTIRTLTNGIYRDSRLAHFDRSDEWASIFNRTEYEVEGDKPRKGGTK